LSPDLERELQVLLTMDEDELSAELARADPEAEDALYSFASACAHGRELLTRLSSTLHDRICVDWRFCERRKTELFKDDVALAVAVSSVILPSIGALPVGVVAALLVKRRLTSFCSCEE